MTSPIDSFLNGMAGAPESYTYQLPWWNVFKTLFPQGTEAGFESYAASFLTSRQLDNTAASYTNELLGNWRYDLDDDDEPATFTSYLVVKATELEESGIYTIPNIVTIDNSTLQTYLRLGFLNEVSEMMSTQFDEQLGEAKAVEECLNILAELTEFYNKKGEEFDTDASGDVISDGDVGYTLRVPTSLTSSAEIYNDAGTASDISDIIDGTVTLTGQYIGIITDGELAQEDFNNNAYYNSYKSASTKTFFEGKVTGSDAEDIFIKVGTGYDFSRIPTINGIAIFSTTDSEHADEGSGTQISIPFSKIQSLFGVADTDRLTQLAKLLQSAVGDVPSEATKTHVQEMIDDMQGNDITRDTYTYAGYNGSQTSTDTDLKYWHTWQMNARSGEVVRTSISALSNNNEIIKAQLRKTMFVFEEFYTAATTMMTKIHSFLRDIARHVQR